MANVPQRGKALQECADRVNQHLEKAAASVIDAGRALIEIKQTVSRGEWSRLFMGASDAVAQPIRISLGTAERLMKIAGHPVLSKSAHAPILPSSWMTLYELTKVPDEQLTTALTDGRITPGMQREDAVALRGAVGPGEADVIPEPPGVDEPERRDDPEWWAHRINAQLDRLAAKHRSHASVLLEAAGGTRDQRHALREALGRDPGTPGAMRRRAAELLTEAEELSPSVAKPAL